MPTDTAILCSSCGAAVARTLLNCPVCHKLIYAEELNRLAAEAGVLEQSGDFMGAITLWRQALQLLPAGTVQHKTVAEKIAVLTGHAPGPQQAPKKRFWQRVVEAGPVGVVLLVLSKAKFLLLGLTKAGTLFSMLLSFGVYVTIFGWKFAAGLLICIYIHEMGHVAALLRLGIKASAPMFIPGFGALVRLHQYPANPHEDATVGLAGPLWGLGATIGAALVWYMTGWDSWAAIARASAWINLFNLIPIWQLDGGRGFRALNKQQRWMAVFVLAAMFFITGEGLLLIMAGLAIYRAVSKDAPQEFDGNILAQYALLVVLLSILSMIPVAARV